MYGDQQKNASIGSYRFYVTFTIDCSRKTWIYFMKENIEVFDCFRKVKCMVEKQSGTRIKCLRSDGGGEDFSKQISDFLCN